MAGISGVFENGHFQVMDQGVCDDSEGNLLLIFQ
jgi:hypothetical protein